VSELLKLYRVCYREGHYRACEILASKALELDPTNLAAEHALTVARLANQAAHDDHCRDGAEECDVNLNAARLGCGMCRSMLEAVKEASRTKANAKCACAGECKCCQDPTSCTCGEKCPCKQPPPRQRVRGVCTVVVPNMVPYFVPGPNGEAVALPCPLPPNVMPVPVPNLMHGCCPAMPLPPGVMPCPAVTVVPEPVPMPTLDPPAPRVVMTGAKQPSRKHPSVRIDVRDNQVHVTAASVEACADSVTSTAEGRAVFKGNACVTFHGDNLPARILADCIVVDLEDGSYEVNPQDVDSQALKQIGYKPWLKKYSKAIAPVKPTSGDGPAHRCPCEPCMPDSSENK
jgi:hypothetical protein